MSELRSEVLIIAGMHRSGTSVVSQWLHKCNMNLGDDLMGPGVGNVEGHFEDIDLYRYHQDVLRYNDLPESGFVDRPIKDLTLYQEEKLKAIAVYKSTIHEQWGWKEPRTCLFLPHYYKHIPKANYLIVIRDHGSVINSLLSRDFVFVDKKYLSRRWVSRKAWVWFRREKRRRKFYMEMAAYYLNVWITYSTELLKHIKRLPQEKYVIVDYKLLLSNDMKVFSVLTDQWGFSLQYTAFEKIFKEKLISNTINIDGFIADKDLLDKARNIESQLRSYI